MPAPRSRRKTKTSGIWQPATCSMSCKKTTSRQTQRWRRSCALQSSTSWRTHLGIVSLPVEFDGLFIFPRAAMLPACNMLLLFDGLLNPRVLPLVPCSLRIGSQMVGLLSRIALLLLQITVWGLCMICRALCFCAQSGVSGSQGVRGSCGGACEDTLRQGHHRASQERQRAAT